MTNQPHPTAMSFAACAYLTAGGIFAATLAVLAAVNAVTPIIDVQRGTSGLLAAAIAVCGIGAIIQRIADRFDRRHDELEARLDLIARKLDELTGPAIDEESAAAARRLNLRLLSGHN